MENEQGYHQLPLFVSGKVCPKCAEWRPLTEWGISSSTKDGLQSLCKPCRFAYRAAHAEEERKRTQLWYLANRDKARAASQIRGAEWYQRKKNGTAGRKPRSAADLGETYEAWRAAAEAKHRAYWRQYYIDHVENIKAKDKRYMQIPASKEQSRVRSRRYLHSLRGQSRARQYRKEHRQEIAKLVREWRKKNYHRALDRERRYRAAHPIQHRAYGHTYRIRKREGGGTFTAVDIETLYINQDGRCAYCGVALTAGYEIEHKQPVSRGGSNWPDNLCLSCPPCNRSKGPKTEEEFMNYRASLPSA